jgi:uncharacterized cupredoxin-like copper-binding protein
MPRLKAVLMSAAVGVALVSVAMGAWSSAQAQTRRPIAIKVKLTNFKIAPSTKSVRAGNVIKTRLKAADLPVRNAIADQKGMVAELGDIQPNQTRRLTVKLKRGHYALICNVTGHYAAGMHTDFTVR